MPGDTSRGMARLRAPRLGFIGTFALLSGAAITVLGLALAQIESVHDRADATDHAAASAQLLVQVGLQPHVDRSDMENGLPPSAVQALDDAFQAGLADGQLTRIKLWSPSGQVLYSDQHELIGQTFPIERRSAGGPRRRADGRGERSQQGGERVGAPVRAAPRGVRAGASSATSTSGRSSCTSRGRRSPPTSMRTRTGCTSCWPQACSCCGRCCSGSSSRPRLGCAEIGRSSRVAPMRTGASRCMTI